MAALGNPNATLRPDRLLKRPKTSKKTFKNDIVPPKSRPCDPGGLKDATLQPPGDRSRARSRARSLVHEPHFYTDFFLNLEKNCRSSPFIDLDSWRLQLYRYIPVDVMGVHTTLIELCISTDKLQTKDGKSTVEKYIQSQLQMLGFTPFGPVQTQEDGPMLAFYTGENHSHAVSRICMDGLITLDITQVVSSDNKSAFTDQKMEELTEKLKAQFKGTKENCYPAFRRGESVQRYFPTTDNLLIEYDFDECVFEADSEFQNIKIMHSNQYGNMLILDNDPNLAESDLPYTHAITGHGHENYKDKTVLVLGGGDGGILNEVLKESPKMVTMVDIDGMVVEAAIKHLRGICYDSMDKLKGDNYEVLIADCVPILEKFGQDGVLFDYVINDLTAIPCTLEPVGNHWDFLRLILDLSMKVLSPTGKYYTQGNGANMKSALAMYEKQLELLKSPVEFKTNTVCVPSYHEMWVFYEIWKQPEGADGVKT